MDSVKGKIKKYIFYDINSGYGVVLLDNRITVTGVIPNNQIGRTAEFLGSWTEHPRYGRQFKFDSFIIENPADSRDIVNFLGSGILKGVAEKLAVEIVETFGEDTLRILNEQPNELKRIKGLGKKKIEDIKKSWEENKRLIELGLFLNQYGISFSYAVKIEKIFGSSSLQIIKNNPYLMVNRVWGIGFAEADKIAFKIGMAENNPVRIKFGILFILEEAARNGHVYIAIYDLIAETMELLHYELAVRDGILTELEDEKEIIISGNKVYLSKLYYFERGIEENIKRISAAESERTVLAKLELHKLRQLYSTEQIDAIVKSLNNKIFILTGGPGTGKTETLKGIIDIYSSREHKILLAAPTGRAAKRMTEIIGKDAKTIHRLLEYNPVQGVFCYNSEKKLEADLIIIDEVSMIDTSLMYNLLEAVDDKTSLILVGDINQLPSIGPGNILRDLIESGIPAVSILEKIYRQAEQSGIIILARSILKGDASFRPPGKSGDVVFIEENNEEDIPEIMLNLCTEILPGKYGYDPVEDVQVLCPMHKGLNGTINYNKLLQKGLNGNEILLKSGRFEYRRGDKIMQLHNNYDKDIYNGDWGYILAALKNKIYNAVFNDRTVILSEDDFEQITLAYSITVHKSQGSEYPCVIIPVVNSNFIMLQKNLIYTAVTRAKDKVIIVGSKKAFHTAVNNDKIIKRNTSLFKESPGMRKYISFEY